MLTAQETDMLKFIVGFLIGALLFAGLPHMPAHGEPQCCYYGHMRVCPCE